MSESIFGGTPVPVMVLPKSAAETQTSQTSQPAEPLGLVERLRAKFSSSAHDLERMREEVARNERAMEHAQSELKRLTIVLGRVEEALTRADGSFARRKAEIAEREAALPELWGRTGDPGFQDGPSYASLVALRASIEDFPRCRKQLVAKVEAAKKELREFEKANT